MDSNPPPNNDQPDPPPATANPPERARFSIPPFLFISFMLFLLTNHNGDEFLARHQYRDALEALSDQLSNYTLWLSGAESNFSIPEQDPSIPPLINVFDIGGGLVNPLTSSYYSNATGTFHGDAAFHNITPPSLNNSAYEWSFLAENFMKDANMSLVLEQTGSWNWSASGKMAMSLLDKPLSYVNASEDTVLVHGKIELTDQNTSEDLKLQFVGIHFVSNGTMYAPVVPVGGHIDIRSLPSIVPEAQRNETARMVEPELQSQIDKLKKLIDAGVIEQETALDETIKTSCPFTLYAALDPVSVPEALLRDLEEETQRPAGIWTVSPPPMTISGLLISKECGILYEFHKAEGIGLRSLFRKLTTYAGTTAVVYLAMLILLSRQMQHSRTPSGITRLSFWTFLIQAIVDALSFAGHTVFALVADGQPSLSLIAPAFLACVLFANEAQFATLIQQFQAPEDAPSRPPAPAAANDSPPAAAETPAPDPPSETPDATPTPQTPGLLPTPAVQAPSIPNQPSFLAFFIQHVRSDPQMRMWLVLSVFLTLMVHTILSATLSIVFVVVSYSLFWLPQIFRSVRRGRGSGLAMEYLVGTTLCRLYVALYFLLCPKNVLDIEPRAWAPYLAAFVCVQMVVVLLQDTALGPTFFLPQRYASVKTYDYHPVMPLPGNDPEAGDQSLGDCAICMDAIQVDPSLHRRTSLDYKSEAPMKGTSKRKSRALLNAVQRNATGRKNYSLAPCHHLFHTECLEKWLAIKNICPQCRRPLPPL